MQSNGGVFRGFENAGGFFEGETPLPSSEPRRLGQTPLSGTQVPQRLLRRLRRGRLRPPPAVARPTQTPELVGMQRSSAPSSRRYRPSAHDSARKPCASLRVAQIIATILRAVPSFHEARAAKAVTLRADLRPPKVSRSVAQPPRISGEASRWPNWMVPPR